MEEVMVRKTAKGRVCGVLFFALTLSLFGESLGCRREVSAPYNGFSVLVTVQPIAGLVRAVGGDTCHVVVLVPPGEEPETFMPTPSEMKEITRCGIFFRVGLPAEESLAHRLRSLNPSLRVVDLNRDLPIVPEPLEENNEQEGPDDSDEHCHGVDPHVWMSPSNLIVMAKRVEETLSETIPENADLYRAEGTRFRETAEKLRHETAERLSGLSERTLYVFHPAYGHYCAEFGLRQMAVEAGGKAPKSKDFVRLIQRLREEKAQKIFVQPQFSRTSVDKISEALHLNIEVHSPLEEDPLENIRTLTDALLR